MHLAELDSYYGPNSGGDWTDSIRFETYWTTTNTAIYPPVDIISHAF